MQNCFLERTFDQIVPHAELYRVMLQPTCLSASIACSNTVRFGIITSSPGRRVEVPGDGIGRARDLSNPHEQERVL